MAQAATVPGPSPLQEQLFFGLFILLMLFCLLRSGCVRGGNALAQQRARPTRTPTRTGHARGADARVRRCRSKDTASGSNKKARDPCCRRPWPSRGLALVGCVSALRGSPRAPARVADAAVAALLTSLRPRCRRWTTAPSQTTRTAMPCLTRATEHKRATGHVLGRDAVLGRKIVDHTCACVGYTAADTSAFAAQRHNKRLRHRPASRRFAVRFLFSAARDATALARPRALHAPQPLARSSLAFGSSGFHGQACARARQHACLSAPDG